MGANEAVPRRRRVVTGVGDDGRSAILHDAAPTARVERPGGATVTEIWRVDEVPARIADRAPLDDTQVVAPAKRGLAVRMCTFPPDSELDEAAFASYATAMAGSYGDGAADGADAIPGLHRTETVDVLTVIDGELWLVTESGETCLRAGDSVVQRGTAHAWRNRSATTATAVAIMIGARDDA
jgi:hypothetical protein